MKRILEIALFGIIWAGMAFAQGDEAIMVFSDLGALSCGFPDVGSLVQVYVFHVNSPGATASEWMIETPGWTYLGNSSPFPFVIGTPPTGVSISYEACLTGKFKLMTINFLGSAAPNCSFITIEPAPGNNGVRAVDCAEHSRIIGGGRGVVNPDYTCNTWSWCLPPIVPVEQTSWGQIKALYK